MCFTQVYLPETCTEHLKKTVLTNLNHQFSSVSPSGALTPRTTSVWLPPQCYNYQNVLQVIEKGSQLQLTQLNSTNSSDITLRLQQTPQLLFLNHSTVLVLWEADPVTYSTGHQRQHLACYTCTFEKYQITLAERTLSTIAVLDTELNTSTVSWQ